MNETILIVEDDQEIRQGLRDNLEFEGYRVEDAWNFSDAEEKWRAAKPSLVILDLMLPGRSGYQLLKEMRASGLETPVIILSARGELWDKVKGFRLGCDDYVVKPFSIIELLARIKALLKRSIPPDEPKEIIRFANLKLDIPNRRLTTSDKVNELALKEFELLFYFLNNPGRVIPRKELLAEVWNSSPKIVTRTVDVYVSNLRKKLTGSGYEIQAVYKVGYRFRVMDEEIQH
ncbi:MAG: response regulator transcription factor [Candidatus Hatepunaea meridiana]|nr:response regulator transcription factor [Candidatus Hatepunaea meridiana]